MRPISRNIAVFGTLTLSVAVGRAIVAAEGEPVSSVGSPDDRPKRPQKDSVQPEPDTGKSDAPEAQFAPEADACARELIDIESQLLATASQARASAVCRTARDCSLIDLSIPCQSMCASAIPRSGVEATKARVSKLGRAFCERQRSCSMSAACPPIRSAACSAGQCVPDVTPWLSNPDSATRSTRGVP